MINIKIPKKIKVGGYDYKIEISEYNDKELDSDCRIGDHSGSLKRIRIKTNLSPQVFSAVVIHEITHAVDNAYSGGSLTESQVTAIENGFLQVFEQMGLRFVRSRDEDTTNNI